MSCSKRRILWTNSEKLQPHEKSSFFTYIKINCPTQGTMLNDCPPPLLCYLLLSRYGQCRKQGGAGRKPKLFAFGISERVVQERGSLNASFSRIFLGAHLQKKQVYYSLKWLHIWAGTTHIIRVTTAISFFCPHRFVQEDPPLPLISIADLDFNR